MAEPNDRKFGNKGANAGASGVVSKSISKRIRGRKTDDCFIFV